jgi:hypothetical protein
MSRRALFTEEPVPGLRGLAALGDPDDGVAAVIDVPVIGARGDGKTQFIVHAIRTLRAHAPALAGDEQALNREVMRIVLDPRAPRPDATPPGVVPHYVFRVRPAAQLGRLGWLGALGVLRRGGGAGGALALSTLVAAAVGAVIAAATRDPAFGAMIGAASAAIAAVVALVAARRRLARAGEIEVVFWDVAGEHVYSAAAADYYALLASLVDARRRRAAELGRGYALAPALICNPVALGTDLEGSPYHRLRQLLPLFAALDRDAARALIAINRWSVVDPICARGADRDEEIGVHLDARADDEPRPPVRVVRDVVRGHCLDVEDGRDGEVAIRFLRYDTAIAADISVEGDGAIRYEFDDGPGAFTGDAQRVFLRWLVDLVRWPRLDVAPVRDPSASAAAAPAHDPSATLRGVGTMPASRESRGAIPPSIMGGLGMATGTVPPPSRTPSGGLAVGAGTGSAARWAEPDDAADLAGSGAKAPSSPGTVAAATSDVWSRPALSTDGSPR